MEASDVSPLSQTTRSERVPAPVPAILLPVERRLVRLRALRWVLAAVMLLLTAGCTSSASDPEEADGSTSVTTRARGELLPTITLGVTDWTAARLNVAIAEQIIERRLGYPVESEPILDNRLMLRDVAAGDLDAVLELWPSTLETDDRDALEDGRVENLGPLGVEGKTGWFVPAYVLDTFPDLTDWEALDSSEVAAEFATGETGTRGQFLGTDSNDQGFDGEIIDELDLPFEVVFSGSDEATRDELARASAAGDPLLLFWWTPTAEAAQYDLVNVALPERTAECEADMADGEPQRCDYPSDELVKIGSPDLSSRAADVHSFLSAFTLTIDDQLAMIDQVDNQDMSVDEVAAQWIAENEDRWQDWLG